MSTVYCTVPVESKGRIKRRSEPPLQEPKGRIKGTTKTDTSYRTVKTRVLEIRSGEDRRTGVCIVD